MFDAPFPYIPDFLNVLMCAWPGVICGLVLEATDGMCNSSAWHQWEHCSTSTEIVSEAKATTSHWCQISMFPEFSWAMSISQWQNTSIASKGQFHIGLKVCNSFLCRHIYSVNLHCRSLFMPQKAMSSSICPHKGDHLGMQTLQDCENNSQKNHKKH